ncbi:biotin/lipoyl-binding protein [Acaryochloris sp. 'Moss Beach']|uniref:efflux RND transporter periplasmic adaptor subunit n=1 Tax=Acaryochloris sp. 'Moss Beach' TaxID=2740837 RepID=UPI001F2C93A8|nr:efflux RND transporter periplasmic adaptor subunit [Acaryochloris sp. 'Moss Beach']UJB69973.1 biotin/lipoyl-binding protein [Acaryochloris sp. 'Moss Beach']
MNSCPLKLKPKPWLIGTLIAAIAASGGIVFVGLAQSDWQGTSPSDSSSLQPSILPNVAALGRLEPTGEIVKVAAPLALDGDRLTELKVKLGDTIQAGDPIAVLDSRDRLLDEVAQAQAQLRVTQVKLAQVQAGAKPGAINAQRATVSQQSAEAIGQLRIQRQTIARLEAQYEGDRTAQTAAVQRLAAELRTAQKELARYQSLYQAGAVSASLFDSKQLSVETTQQALKQSTAELSRTDGIAQRRLREAQAELGRLESTGQAQVATARSRLAEVAEVRSVDIQMAQAEVNAAQVSLTKAKKNLARATVKAPSNGQILQIYTRPGEQMSSDGIVALGQTAQMLVIAEVYQSDIHRVQIGQAATIRGQGFTGELKGKVVELGRQISRQQVFSGDPGENLDRRVVEVKIALKPTDSQQVANLSNLQVQTVIQISDES